MKEIHKIEYIIHPAFAVGLTHLPSNNQTEAQMEKYVSQVLLPVIKQSQRDPGAFVVLLKSPVSKETEKYDAAKMRVEDKLGKIVKRLLPKRSVVVNTLSVLEHKNPKAAATEEIMLALEKFNLFSRPIHIHGYGSFRDMCVQAYAKDLQGQLLPSAKLKVIEAGTIPFKGTRMAPQQRLFLAKKILKSRKIVSRRR